MCKCIRTPQRASDVVYVIGVPMTRDVADELVALSEMWQDGLTAMLIEDARGDYATSTNDQE